MLLLLRMIMFEIGSLSKFHDFMTAGCAKGKKSSGKCCDSRLGQMLINWAEM